MSDLPAFRPRPRAAVQAFLDDIFTPPGAHRSRLVRLDEFPDHHYRAIFRRDYFVLAEGQAEPSRSQWNTLKKKIKRHDPRTFIFKAHGELPCGADDAPGERCCYLEFGFFASQG